MNEQRKVSREANWSANPTSGTARLTIGGKVYEVVESNIPGHLGLLLWPGEVTLAEEVARRDWTGLQVVEFECGTGLAGMVAADRGGQVTFVDRDPVVIGKLSGTREAICSDWSQYDGVADAVIISAYLLTPILVETLARVWTGKGPCLVVNCGWANEQIFANALSKNGIDFSTQELTGRLENGTEYVVQLWTLKGKLISSSDSFSSSGGTCVTDSFTGSNGTALTAHPSSSNSYPNWCAYLHNQGTTQGYEGVVITMSYDSLTGNMYGSGSVGGHTMEVEFSYPCSTSGEMYGQVRCDGNLQYAVSNGSFTSCNPVQSPTYITASECGGTVGLKYYNFEIKECASSQHQTALNLVVTTDGL